MISWVDHIGDSGAVAASSLQLSTHPSPKETLDLGSWIQNVCRQFCSSVCTKSSSMQLCCDIAHCLGVTLWPNSVCNKLLSWQIFSFSAPMMDISQWQNGHKVCKQVSQQACSLPQSACWLANTADWMKHQTWQKNTIWVCLQEFFSWKCTWPKDWHILTLKKSCRTDNKETTQMGILVHHSPRWMWQEQKECRKHSLLAKNFWKKSRKPLQFSFLTCDWVSVKRWKAASWCVSGLVHGLSETVWFRQCLALCRPTTVLLIVTLRQCRFNSCFIHSRNRGEQTSVWWLEISSKSETCLFCESSHCHSIAKRSLWFWGKCFWGCTNQQLIRRSCPAGPSGWCAASPSCRCKTIKNYFLSEKSQDRIINFKTKSKLLKW